jgi:hypothetical protein
MTYALSKVRLDPVCDGGTTLLTVLLGGLYVSIVLLTGWRSCRGGTDGVIALHLAKLLAGRFHPLVLRLIRRPTCLVRHPTDTDIVFSMKIRVNCVLPGIFPTEMTTTNSTSDEGSMNKFAVKAAKRSTAGESRFHGTSDGHTEARYSVQLHTDACRPSWSPRGDHRALSHAEQQGRWLHERRLPHH